MAAVGQRHFFCIDNDMVYWNFYLDFGPLNLGHVYRFCLLMNAKLKDPKLQDKLIYFYSAEHPHKRTNAVFLICAWLMLCKGKTPEESFAPFKNYYLPFPPWVSNCTRIACMMIHCTCISGARPQKSILSTQRNVWVTPASRTVT
jgi:hypothetical protein